MAAEKLYQYEGFVGRLHGIRDDLREKWLVWKENNPDGILGKLKAVFKDDENQSNQDVVYEDFSHLYRRKTRKELVRISAAVMGIEFSYAAETAFVSPTLLKIGVEHKHMTLVWALSPLIGFFLTPVLGSLSDRCHLTYGRRRPFIFIMSLGVLLGLLLVPNGESLGYSMGDFKASNRTSSKISAHRTSSKSTTRQSQPNSANFTQGQSQLGEPWNDENEGSHSWGIFFTVLGTVLLDFDADACQSPARAYLLDVTTSDDHARGLSTFTVMAGLGGFLGYALGGINWDATFIGILFGGHVRAVFSLITVIFIVCVSYTLTSFKEMPLRLLELKFGEDMECTAVNDGKNVRKSNEQENDAFNIRSDLNYGTLEDGEDNMISTTNTDDVVGTNDTMDTDENRRVSRKSIVPSPDASLMIYLQSIIYMPYSIRMVCLTNLFCWMAHVCYSLYFTDFVGEAVFQGNPTANRWKIRIDLIVCGQIRFYSYFDFIDLEDEASTVLWSLAFACYMYCRGYALLQLQLNVRPNSVKWWALTWKFEAPEDDPSRELYEAGVRFGCWGMSMYSLSCACYSMIIERLIQRFGAKLVYVGGLVTYSSGMLLMALTKHKVGVILFSWTAGVMYSTLFTMPYLLIAHYHATGAFEVTNEGGVKIGQQIRGLGTDVAIVSSMVFLAQFILSICMGTIVSVSGTTTAVVSVASCLAFFGAISATQVIYLDL